MGVDRLAGQVVVVEVGVGVAVTLGGEEDAGVEVGDAQAGVLLLRRPHLQVLKGTWQLAAGQGRVVLNEQVEVALVVAALVARLLGSPEHLKGHFR